MALCNSSSHNYFAIKIDDKVIKIARKKTLMISAVCIAVCVEEL